MAELLAKLRTFTYRYPEAAAPALDRVDLELAGGEFIVLAGRSGSGKSTLLRALCGLVPHYHGGEVEGSLAVCGLDVRDHGPAELGGAVGLVAQDPESQVIATTVRGELELPLELRSEPPAARARAIEEVALALGIAPLLDRPTDTLSGGELQRVALAAALVLRPRLVLLDEPTSQLDPVAGDELIGLLRRLNEEWGMAIVLAEHRLERCLAAADRVVALDRGRLGFDGSPCEFAEWAAGADASLMTPAGRLFSLAGIRPYPVAAKDARQILDAHGFELPLADRASAEEPARQPKRGLTPFRKRRGEAAALGARGLWVELDGGETRHEALRGIDLEIGAGEKVALMGRNGAGKSTLLRAAAGLVDPAAGAIMATDGIALLPQSPGDLFVRERVDEELPGEAGERALAAVGLEWAHDADPRDLSGGERERLALAIVMAGREADRAGVVCLDEPTRGMDNGRKDELIGWLGELRRGGLGGARRHPRCRVRCPLRRARCPAGRRRADRRRAGWRDPLRWLVLRHRGRPDTRRRRGDDARARRGGAARVAAGGGREMSWQLVSFAILAAVLIAGFVWWERSRPPSRLVALVAALAALAVAGRLIFAPVPNLVATTDVALLTGYALGGPPGFAVGALAAPISNIWLGQGPWTAWQMAGWGLVGLGGAAVAAATGRRLGRLGLATVCGLAGFAYGALLDLSVMVTYGGEQSLDRYLFLSGKGLPFNIVHAAGNFALAFAAGPALVRLISRYRTRLEFTWRPAVAVPLVLVAVAIPSVTSSLSHPPDADAKAPTALGWLIGTQNDDGGFAASPGQPSNPAMTGWVMLGLEAAGRNPLDVSSGGEDPVAYLKSEADRLRSVGDLERTVLALAGAGLDPTQFAGRDLVAQLDAKRDSDGSVDGQVNLTAFYVLAMRSAGADGSQLARSRRWLVRAQGDDGGWGFQPEAPSDPDTTGAALQAVAAAGEAGKPVAAGVRYLRRSQRPNGGFALATSGIVNSQSTAWAVQGMVATGTAGKPRRSALAYIESLQASDGHYRYSSASDQTPVWVTAQALLAVNRQAFPLAEVARAPKPEAESGEGAAPSAEPSSTPPSSTGPVITRGDGGSGGAGGATSSDGAESGTAAGGSGEGSVVDGDATVEGASGTEDPTALAESPTVVSPAPADGSSSDDDSSTFPYVAGGLAALAAALAGGFLWYRNRLP